MHVYLISDDDGYWTIKTKIDRQIVISFGEFQQSSETIKKVNCPPQPIIWLIK